MSSVIYFKPKNINSYFNTVINTLEGVEKIKFETKQSEEYFFHQCCKKTATNTVMATSLIGWLHCTIIGFSLFIGIFQWAAKFCVFASKMCHSG